MKMEVGDKYLSAVFFVIILITSVSKISQASDDSITNLILEIKSISVENESDESMLKIAEKLITVVTSEDRAMHSPWVEGSGDFGTYYHPRSTYAIWALSKIVEDPPMTYFDEDWKDGVNMTGERKRWKDWWDKNSKDIKFKKVDQTPAEISDELIAAEKAAQDANFELYIKISNADAIRHIDGKPGDYHELEQKFLFPEGESKSRGGIEKQNKGNYAILNHSENLNGSNGTLAVANDATQNKYKSKLLIVVVIIAVLGIFIFLFQAFSRGRES